MRKSQILLGGVSVLVLVGAATLPSFAQDEQMETVVVTGRRAAMKTAVDIKQNSDQIVDSVVADDVGKLPDASVTEVLQRIAGVSITHFGAAGDPDHYSVEGSGVAIRGMTQVNSTLNGRESFSANGGRALLWEDVPPELMSAVNIYKSSTADQLEGGVGGTVDLRTHMPFDFDGLTVRATAGGSYGDFIKEAHPSGSVLVSDRWDTGIGEIGLLVDMAYSDLSYRNDTMQIEPYYPHVGVNQSGSWSTRSDTVYIPGGFDYRTSDIDRKRAGFYEALQWKPMEGLSFYQTSFVSYYNSKTSAYALMDAAGEAMTLGADSTWSKLTNYELDKNNSVTYADNLVNSNFRSYTPYGMTCVRENGTSVTNSDNTGGDCSLSSNITEYSASNNRTTDLTEGFNWLPNDSWRVSGAFQYVHSTSGTDSLAVYGSTMVSAISMDLRNAYPEITIPNASSLVDASATNWAATMDHHARNSGTELAANVDAEWTPSGIPVLKSVAFGLRTSSRKENDSDTGYNYTSLSPWYADYTTAGNSMHYFSQDSSDVDTVTFKNYFRGKIAVPGSALFPSLAKVKEINTAYWHEKYSYDSDSTGNDQFDSLGRDTNHGVNQTVSGYVSAKFASSDGFFGMPYDGNVGVRVVYNHNYSSGYIKQTQSTDLAWTSADVTSGNTFDIPNAYTYREGGRDTWNALPSFNFDVMPTDRVHARLALSETMGNMSFSYMQAGGSMSVSTTNNVVRGFTASTGTPDLKPQLSRNLDLSLEWYGDNGDAAHISGFWKSIKNYITYGVSSEEMTFNLGSYGDQTRSATVTNYMNSDKETVIRGFEAGFTKFADFLPAPFDGLGIDANFTYIDSRSPGDASYDMNGNLITGMPVDMLSRYNYNVTGMYEKGPFSVR
ncbi:MAG: TonB-dependent receptor, partial [Rhizomicrobium sp.]